MLPFRKTNLRLSVQITLLLSVIFFCYLPALDSFFVADDLWQVHFAHKVFEGRADLIWRNFTSNYLQLPSFDFYRPLLGFTFLIDYLFYSTNALGYHITNLVLYAVTVQLLFLCVRTMTRSWPDFNSSWAAFFTALLFAVSPLHCEDVTWISGRADILSAPLYLLSLYLVVRSHQKRNRRLYLFSLLSFWAAILSKEIAIGLPAVVAAYYFIWSEEEKFSELFEKPKPVVEDEEKPPEEEQAKQKKATAAQIAYAERALKKGKKKRKKKGSKSAAGGAVAGAIEGESPKDTGGDARGGADDSGTAGWAGNGAADGRSTKKKQAGWTFFKRLALAARLSAPFFLSGAVYLVVRYKVLGTLVGGYSGMMGGALERHVLLRWIDPSNIERILLPFPRSILSDNMVPKWTMILCLVMCLILVLLRFLVKSNPTCWFSFLLLWMITGIAPLAKLWGVGSELETSRLLFFFSMGYSALWPMLIFHPPKSKMRVPAVANRSLGYVGAFLFIVMGTTYAWSSFSTNLLWLIAGQEFKRLWLDTVNLASNLKQDEKLIILGIPKEYRGAHVNFNGSTFHHMLRPPFVAMQLTQKVITFEPYIVGPFEVINSERLKSLMQFKNIKGPYIWKRSKLRFEPLKLGGKTGLPEAIELPFHPTSDSAVGTSAWRYDGKGTVELKNNGIKISDTEDGAALKIDKLDICPFEFDFLEFDIQSKLKPDDNRVRVPMAVGWNSLSVDINRKSDWAVLALKVDKITQPGQFRLQLSHYWQWLAAGTINSMVMRLFDADLIEIRNVRLVKKDRLVPFLGVRDILPLNSGEYLLGGQPLAILFDGSVVPGARSVEIEVTKPNYFFDNYLIGTKDSAVSKRLKVPLTKGVTMLEPSLFATPAYYEIRARCFDAKDEPIGAWSEYVTILRMGGGLDTYVF